MAEQAAVVEGSHDGRIRWWDPVIAFVGGSAAGIVLASILGGAALLIAMRMGYQPSGPKLITLLKTSFATNQFGLAVSDLGLLLVVWLVARRRMVGPIAHYFRPIDSRTLLLALGGGLALSLVLNGANEILYYARIVRFQSSDMERALVPHTAIQFLLSIAVVSLLAPFVEEFLFRGLLVDWLKRRGLWIAAIASALAFAAVHGQFLIHPGVQGWLYTVELLIAGVILALVVARTGSLRTSLATHAAYNAAATLLSMFFV